MSPEDYLIIMLSHGSAIEAKQAFGLMREHKASNINSRQMVCSVLDEVRPNWRQEVNRPTSINSQLQMAR